MNISPADRQKYSNIFQAQNPVNGKLSGQQAKAVFMQSGLALPQLGQIWNLCDIDKDGQMDVEEFILAMHFIFSTLSGSLQVLPLVLPQHLIPVSKNQYNASRPLAPVNPAPTIQPPQVTPSSRSFDWHINSSNKASYDNLFNRFCRPGSSTADLSSLRGFLQEKGFSPNDLNQAWNLVDVQKTQSLSREQFALLLHILDSRNKGIPFPDVIPIHLSNRFLGKTPPPPSMPTSFPRPTNPTQTPYNLPNSTQTQYGSVNPTQMASAPVHIAAPSSTKSNQSWSSDPRQVSNPQLAQASLQEAQEKERRLKEEIAQLDRKLASPTPDHSMAHKTKEELERLLAFLQKLEKALPNTSGQTGVDEGTEMLKDLEFLAQSIKDKYSEMTSMVALQKKEYEELQLAINKKKYGV